MGIKLSYIKKSKDYDYKGIDSMTYKFYISTLL